MRDSFATAVGRWLRVPAPGDALDERARRARLFALLLALNVGIVLALGVVFALLEPLGYADRTMAAVALAFPAGSLLVAAGCLVVARRGRLGAAVHAYVWIHFVAISAAAWLFQGTSSPAWLLYIWTITVAGALLSPRHALAITGAVLAWFGALLLLERTGLYAPPFVFRPEALQFVEGAVRMLMLVSTVGFVTFLGSRALEDALARLGAQVRVREEAEAAARRSEARFRALIEKGTDLIVVHDAAGRITFWSPSAEEALGWAAAEVVGRPYLDGVHPDDRARLQVVEAELHARPGGTATVTARRRHRDGGWRLVEASCRNLLHDPAVGGVVTNARDVTAQRQLEEQVRQAQKMDAVGRLASGIAHDFNNLLVAILGGAHVLRDELPPGDPLRAEAEAIHGAGERAAKLVRQLLAFGRKGGDDPVLTDLAAGVRGLEGLLRRTIGEHIAIEIASCAAPWPVRVDPTRLEQVVMNLALNARDAMPGAGTLRIEIRNVELGPGAVADAPPGRWACLAVRDGGAGMTPEVRAHLFEPFFTTKAAGAGTGLGLATVFGIVKAAGGAIAVESEPGHGSTFRVYLPAADGAPAEGPAATPAPGAAPGRGRTVLLVEDEPTVRRVVGRMLSVAGFTVVEAAAPDEALARAAVAPFDLVLTDMVMPGMSGLELADRLRALRPAAAVVYMTGYTDAEQRLPEGAVLLHKPFDAGALAAALERCLPARASPARAP